jgi:hypothetical protein
MNADLQNGSCSGVDAKRGYVTAELLMGLVVIATITTTYAAMVLLSLPVMKASSDLSVAISIMQEAGTVPVTVSGPQGDALAMIPWDCRYDIARQDCR